MVLFSKTIFLRGGQNFIKTDLQGFGRKVLRISRERALHGQKGETLKILMGMAMQVKEL